MMIITSQTATDRKKSVLKNVLSYDNCIVAKAKKINNIFTYNRFLFEFSV